MSDVTRLLARARLADDKPGQTLQPTALVDEASLRLVDVPEPQLWNGRGYFHDVAAEAMRRILVEPAPADDLLAVDEALLVRFRAVRRRH